MSDYKMRICGFSLAEVLMVMVIASLLAIATIPVLTKSKLMNTNVNQYVTQCISSGSTSNANCYSTSTESAITDCMYGVNNACEQLIGTIVSGGTSSSTTFPLNVIQTACNMGAAKACDYLIQSCISNSANCNSQSTALPSLYPYLTAPITSTSPGKMYMTRQLLSFCANSNANIINAALANCPAVSPNTSYVACNLHGTCSQCAAVLTYSSTAQITYCNAATSSPSCFCIPGYNSSLNRTCQQIATNYPSTSNGVFNLTTDTTGSYVQSYCDITNGGYTLVATISTGLAPYTEISTATLTTSAADGYGLSTSSIWNNSSVFPFQYLRFTNGSATGTYAIVNFGGTTNLNILNNTTYTTYTTATSVTGANVTTSAGLPAGISNFYWKGKDTTGSTCYAYMIFSKNSNASPWDTGGTYWTAYGDSNGKPETETGHYQSEGTSSTSWIHHKKGQTWIWLK